MGTSLETSPTQYEPFPNFLPSYLPQLPPLPSPSTPFSLFSNSQLIHSCTPTLLRISSSQSKTSSLLFSLPFLPLSRTSPHWLLPPIPTHSFHSKLKTESKQRVSCPRLPTLPSPPSGLSPWSLPFPPQTHSDSLSPQNPTPTSYQARKEEPHWGHH